MSTRRWQAVAGFVAISTVAAGLAAGAVLLVRSPGPAPTVEASGVQIGISAPGLVLVGENIPFEITAVGSDEISTFELWVGSTLVDSTDSNGAPTVTLHWAPTQQGVVGARARAVDGSATVGISNLVQIAVVEPVMAVTVIDAPTTLRVAAIAAGIHPRVAAGHNPGVDLDEELPVGSVVVLPPDGALDELVPDGSAPPEPEGPSIGDGVLYIHEEVDGIFLYVLNGGVVVRVPDDPGSTIPPNPAGVDLRGLLPPLPGGTSVVEVWGRDGGVRLLGSVTVDASDLAGPSTSLVAFQVFEQAGLKLPVVSMTATTKQVVEFEWDSTVPHEGVRWFLSSTKPTDSSALAPSHVLQSGVVETEDGWRRFSIDLAASQVPSVIPQPIDSVVGVLAGDPEVPLQGGPGLRRLTSFDLPGATWAWVIPVNGSGEPVGPASEPVRIILVPAPFDPSDAPPFDVIDIDVTIPPAPNAALASCVRVVSQTPPFPRSLLGAVYLNPDGSTTPRGVAGTKVTGTLPYTLDSNGLAVYPFTACPGERGNFQWGDVGCGADPFCHIANGLTDLGEAAVQFGKFLVGLANDAADAFNQLKAWVVEQVASAVCPSEVGGACKTIINVAVDALLTSVGVPPTMPNFDDLADLAKGELVDLTLEQLGVGAACDALAQAGTGKSCGELATQLQNLDACSLAPKGQEDTCRGLVQQATAICQQTGASSQCALLTKNAKDLVETGVGLVIDESVAAIEAQVTRAALESIGFPSFPASSTAHACHWGGPGGDEVVCPPWFPGMPFAPSTPPAGCYLGSFGLDVGKVICNPPPVETVAIPEPRGQRQPIEIRVLLQRNQNPLPEGFVCGPIYASATSISPQGAVGQPYVPASAGIEFSDFWGTGLHVVTLWLDTPNPHVQVPDEKKPVSDNPIVDLLSDAVDVVGGPVAGNQWTYLLQAGSFVGVTVYGDCIPQSQAAGPFGVAGIVSDPLPRMYPGQP